jgi:hypothetical protein
MPQLKSGRHVGISASPLLDLLKTGTPESVTFAIMAYRTQVSSPQKLRDYLTVGYFREGEGGPPKAQSYNSGFLVKDVLEGKAGWSDEEVAEFINWLDTNPGINDFLAREFEALNVAIRDSLVWDTPLWTDDDSKKPDQ